MTEEKVMRLSQVARKLNVGTSTIAEHLATKGFEVENKPNSKITYEQFVMLAKEFESSALDKEEASGLTIGKKHSDNLNLHSNFQTEAAKKYDDDEIFIKNNAVDKDIPKKTTPATKGENEAKKESQEEKITSAPKLQGIKVVGKIDLNEKRTIKPEKTETEPDEQPKKQQEAEAAESNKETVTDSEHSDKIPTATSESKSSESAELEEIKTEDELEEKVQPQQQLQDEDVESDEEVVEEDEDNGEDDHTISPEFSEEEDVDLIEAKADTLKGLTVLGKIELPAEKSKKKAKPVASSDDRDKKKKKRPRKRVGTESRTEPKANLSQEAKASEKRPEGINRPGTPRTGNRPGAPGPGGQRAAGDSSGRFRGKPGPPQTLRPRVEKEELSDKEIQDKIKNTLAKLSGGKKGSGGVNRAKYRREKRSAMAEANEEKLLQEQEEAKTLKVTEFISANDLASLMGVTVNEIISTCMSLGMFISINQRLDAESITVIADEFGYDVDFASSDDELVVEIVDDKEEDLEERAPIVTIMGHVDHGKTSLLDYIRNSKIAAGEAGGITQHIGAYDVTTEEGKRIAFLDTPGHEAFTAMRARGAKVTDVVIIVVAADDAVMPQTKEAINHAQVAGVPIVIAINKVDKPNANPDKIKEELANINILVEEWGGKYQSQHISAKTGEGINDLLEKVLLEAELLELKANPQKNAVGTVIEATLDKGRGYVTTILVQSGKLQVGDVILAGAHYGKVKAMTNHLGQRLIKAGPSTPVQMLGLDGAPQAGDKFNVMDSEREARELATKRSQLNREQSIRTKKHITLDEIGRRLAIGSFKELNVIVKGDVDGSIEALSDSLLKLSTNEIQVNIIHKAVGQISEGDVLLASASDAVIVGFQVRPSNGARRLAEQEEIEIRLYSIIYDAINDVRDAMEGMLAPKVEETIIGNVDVRDVFKISKIGTVAGCYVTDGTIKRNSQVRLIRDGIVVHTGVVDQLKRFKEDVSEVKFGYECGISIKNFHDIEVGDNIEAFEEKEVKRKL
ncbi:translation initiation factor IF-2 [soil metagenome]